MALRSDWSAEQCPVRRGLDVLGDPWSLLIMRDALQGRRRFEEFRTSLGIADSVLARRLAALVRDGLLVRREYQATRRTHDEYLPTAAGTDLLPVLHALAGWAEAHTALPNGGGHMAIIHTACGAETRSADTCTACGEPLRSQDVQWDKPWSGRRDALVGPAES
ncbi:MAG TPA: helix-turn-helix domain-containing protein [Nakamurella sp.]